MNPLIDTGKIDAYQHSSTQVRRIWMCPMTHYQLKNWYYYHKSS